MTRAQQVVGLFLAERRPSVVEWLERNIVIPRSMSPRQPGPFSTRDRPYMRPVLECWHPDSGVQDCVVSAATQLLKTTVMTVGLGYRVRWVPLPTLVVLPSLHFGQKAWSEEKFMPLVRENPELARYLPCNGDHFASLDMAMQGGQITVAGSNSPTNLSGRPKGIVIQDECCKFEHRSSDGSPEAHPMRLADERTKDFQEMAFRYKSSSPNTDTHLFWSEFEEGDQTEFRVPCPFCGHWFAFDFIEAGDYRSVSWDQSARDKDGLWIKEKVRETSRYICPACRAPIPTEEKAGMIAQFQEHRRNPTALPSRRSFQINSFYSPRISFGDMAVQFLKEKEMFTLQNFFNSWLAKPWAEIDVNVREDQILKLRSEDYLRGQVPGDPHFLIATADPGQTQTHWMVSAVQKDGQIHVIDWGTALSIEDLATIPTSYPARSGPATFPVSRALIDSGYETHRVFDFCARSGGKWWPTKGSEAAFGTWSQSEVRTHRPLLLFSFVDFSAKMELYAHRIAKLAAPRLWLPADASRELMTQLSGQQLLADRGVVRMKRWKKLASDHWGDCLKQVIVAQWVLQSAQTAIGDATAAAAPAQPAPVDSASPA